MGLVTPKVTLLRYTPFPEEIVATAARVCYSSEPIADIAAHVQDDEGWVEKLMAMGHESPVEHAVFTFGIEGVSRSLLAQITRHRIASFSVRSQRYVGETSDGENTFAYVIPPAIQALGEQAVDRFNQQMRIVQQWYDGWVDMLGGGRQSYEDARYVLPNAAATTIVVTMNARELRHFFRLRLCQRAQWEIRALADEMLNLAKQAAPALFDGAGPACVKGACPEGQLGCGRTVEMRSKYR